MPVSFDEATRELLDGKNFATLATLHPSGAPHASVVWYDREGDTLVFSSTDRRRKVRNVAADPRASATVFDMANPYHAVEIRGTAVIEDDPESALPHRLAHRYLGEDPISDPPGVSRKIIRLRPEKVLVFSM
ncbi:PPOX class F420-dependent oxidoreductase [Streptomyces sp. SBT349]|uniref:PPOX class F420-dependent oxidoreductase n=1 Tax=Streptomyces sp. SBT349 TaxID=1580539 RepID=UPI00066E5F8C|nr:PPOX class F420-dependent oxidoreductase [Streptomyces sp. SBT349]